MRNKLFRVLLLATLLVLITIINIPVKNINKTKMFTLPGLPRPIARTPVVITSAGQNTDSYIINDVSNQLMIPGYFMPQAKDSDLSDANTIVFVVGYSALGSKLQNINYEEEKVRIEKLLKKAEDDNLTVLTVVICGEQFNNKTEQLLRLIGKGTDYLIGLRKSSKESILIELARERDIPLTLVAGVKDIFEPFASAFR